jgi:EAL domain-containing protein (putative c-di-GMP-specific phosphodiesterase class I)
MSSQTKKSSVHLEGKTADGSLWIVPLSQSPFVIGRLEGSDLWLTVQGVSRKHAEIREKAGTWWIVDCGSTNGTFVNRRRLTEECALQPGDELQFADVHFTVVERHEEITERTQIVNPHARKFEQMLQQEAVRPCFQPIVRMSDRAVAGYEILGRIDYQGLPQSPGELFSIAKKLGREVELSQLFRDKALAEAARLHLPGLMFFNMLPGEIDLDVLPEILGRLRRATPQIPMVMELHESVVTDAPMIRRLKEILKSLGILLAYDDFGAGQARLVELIEAPPDVIKFDIALIHDIDRRPESSRAIVAALVRMAKAAGVATLAEGVETAEEAAVCKSMGFDLGQGYFFGRPAFPGRNPATTASP